jgi:hypothetical protein
MNLFWGIDHELAGRELSAFAFKWREGKSRSAIMNEKIYFYVYSSTATKAFTQAELLELLKRSREKNSLAGLTGMLLYKNGDFMQVLEGPNQAVHSLIETIPILAHGLPRFEHRGSHEHARLHRVPQHSLVGRPGRRPDCLPAVVALVQGAHTLSTGQFGNICQPKGVFYGAC